MKVVSDSAGTSALDTWLRAAEPDSAPTQAPAVAGNIAALALATSGATRQPRDTAEDLLVLDIWDGHPPGQLQAAHSLAAADATVQQWAEHIFSPLR